MDRKELFGVVDNEFILNLICAEETMMQASNIEKLQYLMNAVVEYR